MHPSAASPAPRRQRLDQLKNKYAAKGARYIGVTVINVLFGQSLLALASAGFGWDYVPSTLFSVFVLSLIHISEPTRPY